MNDLNEGKTFDGRTWVDKDGNHTQWVNQAGEPVWTQEEIDASRKWARTMLSQIGWDQE